MMTVDFKAQDGSYHWGAVNPALDVEPVYHRGGVYGGPMVAEMAVSGAFPALWDLLGWLLRPVEVRGEHGRRLWWGFVNEVRINMGGLTVGVSLDNMANRVAVAYATTDANGSPVNGTTEWVSDTDSISRYGTKELLESLGESGQAAAEAYRNTLLDARAWPRGVPSVGEGTPGTATVICVGWIETLRWLRFARDEGRDEYGTLGGELHAIGWGLTDNSIGFAAEGIHDLDANLTALDVGDQVIVSGTSSNNGTFTVTQAASGELIVYSATTISFDPADDINDSAEGLGFVENDYFIYVSGSSANTGYHLIDETGDGHIATADALTGTISAEAAGPSISITQGHRVTVAEALTDELPGGSPVTLTMVGVQLAQRFTAASGYTVAQIAIPVGRVGSPADNLVVELMSESASAPGSVLEAVSVTGTELIEDDQPFRWITFGETTTLVQGTSYWIRVRRSGSVDAANYYVLGLTDEAGGGSCKVWNGSAWVNHPRGLYLPHKVWGAEENGLQIARIVEDAGQFLAGSDVVTTGRTTPEWRDGTKSAYNELMKLLAQGNSDGKRLLAEVTPERLLRVYAEPDRPDAFGDGDRLATDGTLRGVSGGRRQRGLLPHGEWLVVDELPGYLNAQLEISPLFVDEAAWNADRPDGYEITPKEGGW